FNNGIPFNGILLSLNYIFSFSVSVLAHMIHHVPNGGDLFWPGLNPLPTFITGYDEIKSGVMINSHVPRSAIGEAYSNGPAYLLGLYFLIGMAISFMYHKARNPLQNLLLITALSIFTFISTQYPTRGSTRILYFSALLFFTIPYLTKLRIR